MIHFAIILSGDEFCSGVIVIVDLCANIFFYLEPEEKTVYYIRNDRAEKMKF